MQAIEKRLRIDENIVGFQKSIGKSEYYSPDKLWWSGQKIEYKQFDVGTGFQDINAEWLFENDLIRFKTLNKLILIVYDEVLDHFLGVDYRTNEITHENLLDDLGGRAARRISYTFIQKA